MARPGTLPPANFCRAHFKYAVGAKEKGAASGSAFFLLPILFNILDFDARSRLTSGGLYSATRARPLTEGLKLAGGLIGPA